MSDHRSPYETAPTSVMQLDYFALMGLHPDFALSIEQLDRAYFDLQKQFHPDRAVASHLHSIDCAMVASRINDAYETLKSPLKRACYLFEMHGLPLPFQDHSTIQNSDFLMEMMELRERIAQAQDPNVKKIIAHELDQAIHQGFESFKTAWADGDHEYASRCLVQVHYWTKAHDSL